MSVYSDYHCDSSICSKIFIYDINIEDYEEYSERVFANAAQGTYYPKYIRSVSRGNNYRLAGQTYAYYVHVEGEWEP